MQPTYVKVPSTHTRSEIKRLLALDDHSNHTNSEVLIDKMLFTINLILRRMMQVHVIDENDEDLTYLKSTYLHKQIGNAGGVTYKHVCDRLATTGLIYINPSYKTGKHSKGYGIKEAMCNDLVWEELRFWKPTKPESKKPDDSIDEELLQAFRNSVGEVQVDTNYALQVLNSQNEFSKKLYYIYYVGKLISKDEHDVYVSRHKGRVYHNLTGASRSIRPALTVGDQPIYSVDISSSQPYFAIKKLVGYVKMKARSKDLDVALEKYPDVRAYLNAVTNGTFYQSMLQHLSLSYDYLPKLKTNMLSAFFGKRELKRNSKERKALAALYPTVEEFIKLLKKVHYKEAAAELQKAESDVMIDRVATRILKEGVCKWFLTVHDSVLCLEHDVEYCRNIIIAECTQYVGYSPTVKAGLWTTPKVLNSNSVAANRPIRRLKMREGFQLNGKLDLSSTVCFNLPDKHQALRA